MRTIRALSLGLSAAMTIAVIVLIRSDVMPTGVRGEWVWSRIPFSPLPWDLALAGLGIVGYAFFSAVGMRSLELAAGRRIEARWLGGLVVASVAVQLVAHGGAPTGYGLTKWVTLTQPGSSGYLTVAKARMADPWRFWAEYPAWIKDQDSLHIGTHPPGLFLAARAALDVMAARPGLARGILAILPTSVEDGFKILPGERSRRERAAVALLASFTLLACAATVLPIYWLARSSLPAPQAWSAASLWPLVPSAILFQPTADTAFPFLAALALALAAWGGPARGAIAGLILAIGMQFTLAFLPVGLTVAIVQLWRPGESWRRRIFPVMATGAGFALLTLLIWGASGANPLVIWWWNQRNHARFYIQFPRSYWAWVAINPIELFVAMGIPSALFAAVGFASGRGPRSSWAALAVLIVLNLSGKNLSEVARLWLPFLPALLVAAAAGLARVSGGPRTLAGMITIVGLQTLALEATVQVVYPF